MKPKGILFGGPRDGEEVDLPIPVPMYLVISIFSPIKFEISEEIVPDAVVETARYNLAPSTSFHAKYVWEYLNV
jgi:hypothetical protein